MRNRLIPIFLIFCSISGCGDNPVESVPDNNPRLYFQPDLAHISQGTSIEIILSCENLEKAIFAISMRLNFPPGVTSFVDSTGVTVGSWFDYEGLKFVRSEDSTIYITLSRLAEDASFKTGGNICTFNFSGIASGNANISLDRNELYFYDIEGGIVEIEDLTIGNAQIIVN